MSDVKSSSKLSFPCKFTFKIIGLANDQFEGEVVGILNRHFPQMGEGAITLRDSKNKKYLSYSVTIDAQSQAQLDAAYTDLSKNPKILFVL
tara:strand:- start:4633 stop:4905 length:273 start_codon:yes stop_codon:yes gene_type:complete